MGRTGPGEYPARLDTFPGGSLASSLSNSSRCSLLMYTKRSARVTICGVRTRERCSPRSTPNVAAVSTASIGQGSPGKALVPADDVSRSLPGCPEAHCLTRCSAKGLRHTFPVQRKRSRMRSSFSSGPRYAGACQWLDGAWMHGRKGTGTGMAPGSTAGAGPRRSICVRLGAGFPGGHRLHGPGVHPAAVAGRAARRQDGRERERRRLFEATRKTLRHDYESWNRNTVSPIVMSSPPSSFRRVINSPFTMVPLELLLSSTK